MRKKLLKVLLIFSFLLITFFSINIDSNAASFAYADFNWDEFLKQHKNYWVGGCKDEDEECVDRVLKTKEKFYKRLYSLLADYEKKGYKIDDNIIIETVFFGLTPDSFADSGTHEEEYENQIHEYGYAIDESEKKQKYIASDDGDRPGAQEYFDKEIDSLKTLMNNMIGYTRACYGISSEVPYTVTLEDGTTSVQCSGEFTPMDGKCMVNVQTLKTNFFDSIGLGFLFAKDVEKKCQEITSSYSGYKLGELVPKGVDEEIYWDFLINNVYFDNKFQLQTYFELVLNATGKSKMSDLTPDEYEKYNDEIIAIRTRIVEHIKDIIDSYGEFAETPDSFSNSGNSKKYWWPIGSNEITETDGVKMASGDPASVNVFSKFGLRTDPITKEENTMHYGVDITGEEGKTPVIVVFNGVVVTGAQGETGTCTNGDKECGGGYGNYIVIQHTDGNYTVYSHLATNSVSVKEGDTVKQGQVLGYVGSTGKSTGSHLHFEVRIAGNDTNSAQDPLKYISAESPRTSGANGTMADWIAIMEGGTKKGDNYVVENVGDGYKTFGPGIVTVFNADVIRNHGIDPNSLNIGSLVPISTGNAIFADVLVQHVDSVKKKLSAAGISVNDEQLAALVSLEYNCGNIKGFVEAYNNYGSTNSLCSGWWHHKALHDGNGRYYPGLAKRRKAECNLFVTGNYNMNPYG